MAINPLAPPDGMSRSPAPKAAGSDENIDDISPFLSEEDAVKIFNKPVHDVIYDDDFFKQFNVKEKSLFEKKFSDRPGNMVLLVFYGAIVLFCVALVFYALFGTAPSMDKTLDKRPSISIDPAKIKIIRMAAAPDSQQENAPPSTQNTLNPEEQLPQNLDVPSSDNPDDALNNEKGVDEAKASADIATKPPPPFNPNDVTAANAGYGNTPETALISGDIQDEYANRLAVAPLPDITEPSPSGDLPIISAKGQSPFDLYARPANIAANQVPIAIVMLNLGLNKNMDNLALKLPGAVTLSLSPFGKNLTSFVAQARLKGHELALFLPIQPSDYPYSDAGQTALMKDVELDENLRRYFWSLSRATGYSSLLIDDGGAFMKNANQIAPLLEDLSNRGVALASTSAEKSVLMERSKGLGIMTSNFDVKFAESLTRTSFLQKLLEAEISAQTKGDLIIGVPAQPNNVQRIREWSKDLSNRSLVLVPLSAIIKRRLRSNP